MIDILVVLVLVASKSYIEGLRFPIRYHLLFAAGEVCQNIAEAATGVWAGHNAEPDQDSAAPVCSGRLGDERACKQVTEKRQAVYGGCSFANRTFSK